MESTIKLLAELGAKLRLPADVTMIENVIHRLDVTLPKQIMNLYLEANGTQGACGRWSWQYWGIDSEEITLASYLKPREFVVDQHARIIDPRKYIRFFDCLIDAPLYAFCGDATSPYFGEVIGCSTDGGKFEAFVAAKSVGRFLDKFVSSRGEDTILLDEPPSA